MKNKEKKIVRLLEEGFSYDTIKKMSNQHIDKIFKSIIREAMVSVSSDKFDDIKDKLGPEDKVEVTEETPLEKDAEQNYTGQEGPHDEKDMAPDGMDDDSDNNREEMDESFDEDEVIDLLFGSKKKWNRSPESRAEKEAKKDIRPHYYKSGDPNEFDVESSAEYAIGLEDPSFMMYEGKKKTPPTTLGMFEGKNKKGKYNAWAVCTSSLGLEGKKRKDYTEKESEKFENCVKDVKKQESKEEKIRQIEESIIYLINKSQGKMITKGDLLSEQPSIAPSKPTVKPGTKPERGTPYQPKHSPKPKAGNEGGLPEFLKFNNLNIQFRDE